MRLLSLFMIVGYFEIYEVLMFYHGEKLWLYSGTDRNPDAGIVNCNQ